MTRRLLLMSACACALLGAGTPGVAVAAWTAPQSLGTGDKYSWLGTALASNDRGDAVTAFGSYGQSGGVRIARATAGAPFGSAITVSTDGGTPRVAIDARGVALIAWQFHDGSINESDGFRGTYTCCEDTKVVVWRPGHAPSRPQLVNPREQISRLTAVAAVSGRRGVLIETAEFDDSDGNEKGGALRFVPIGIDGRPGRRRTLPRSSLSGASLQFSRGRAVVGLIGGRDGTRLAVRSQRATGTFGALRVFLRVPEELEHYRDSPEFSQVLMAPDGRGGHLAVLQRGKRPRLHMQFVRKPRFGRLRSVIVRRGPADDFNFSTPVGSSDGWSAVAFDRLPQISGSPRTRYLLAVRPNGRSIVSRLTASAGLSDPVLSLTRGGVGAVGFDESSYAAPSMDRTSFLPFTGGRVQGGAALTRPAEGQVIGRVSLTSNRRDHARAVWQEGTRVLASRQE